MAGSSFISPPSSSRPPTKAYDRQSFVLVMDDDDSVLKFMKMHLNRFFSHVVVARTPADATTFLKQKEFDVIITDITPGKKNKLEFLKKVMIQWRKLPVVLLIEEQEADSAKIADFPYLCVTGIVSKPMQLDPLHDAIRRALEVRVLLKELDQLVGPKQAIGEFVYDLRYPGDLAPRTVEIIGALHKKLTDPIVD